MAEIVESIPEYSDVRIERVELNTLPAGSPEIIIHIRYPSDQEDDVVDILIDEWDCDEVHNYILDTGMKMEDEVGEFAVLTITPVVLEEETA